MAWNVPQIASGSEYGSCSELARVLNTIVGTEYARVTQSSEYA